MDKKEVLDVLMAESAIKRKLYTYCRAVDRLDKKLGHTVFAEDAMADYGEAFVGSAWEAIDSIIESHRADNPVTSHQISNIIVTVDGNRAASEAYCTAAVQNDLPDDEALLVIARTRYNDIWECREGDWVITKRVVSGDITYMTYISPYLMDRYNMNHGGKDDPSYNTLFW